MGLLKKAAGVKKTYEDSLVGFGKRIHDNVAQGQKDLKSGKLKGYTAINPFK